MLNYTSARYLSGPLDSIKRHLDKEFEKGKCSLTVGDCSPLSSRIDVCLSLVWGRCCKGGHIIGCRVAFKRSRFDAGMFWAYRRISGYTLNSEP